MPGEKNPITIRPIVAAEIDSIVLRCWPAREKIAELFRCQETIGMAAWDGDKCVAQLHCYRIDLPECQNTLWPEWNDWRLVMPIKYKQRFDGPVWCHACFHVGRTLESSLDEARPLIMRLAQDKKIAPEEIYEFLQKKNIYHLSSAAIRKIIAEGESENQPLIFADGIDYAYTGQGIGTGLCQASIDWARTHGYAAILAPGAPDQIFEFAVWSGHLPWTTYTRLGFEQAAIEKTTRKLPQWALGDSPPEVMAEVKAALKAGRPAQEFHEKLMLLDLKARSA